MALLRWVLMPAVLLASCTGIDQNISGRDRGVLLPTVRVLAPLVGEAKTIEGEREQPRRVRGIMGIELAGDFASGDFAQDGNGLATDYQMWQASIAARGGVDIQSRLRLEGIGGIGWNEVDFDFTNTGGRQSRGEDGLGLLLGLQLTWEPIDRLALYGRASALTIPADSTSTMAEAGIQVRALDELRFLFGYRSWRYRFEGEGAFGTGDIDLKTDGVLLGAELRF